MTRNSRRLKMFAIGLFATLLMYFLFNYKEVISSSKAGWKAGWAAGARSEVAK